MFGIISARYGHDQNGRKYGFLVYGEKNQYFFMLLGGEPYYNTFLNYNGELDFANMCDNTFLVDSYNYTSDEEFLIAIKKARIDWLKYVNPFLKIV